MMAEHITTYTGIYFYPTDPNIDDIDIKDIAHALSLICRGNGQVQKFFSVGQHCLYCAREAKARGYSDRIVLACLVHDASESYMSDVPRPFKKTLDGYIALEEKLLSLIYEKFLGSDLSEEEKKIVSQIDDDLLYYDLKYLLNENPGREEPDMKIKVSHDFIPFEDVEREYLNMYEKLRAINT